LVRERIAGALLFGVFSSHLHVATKRQRPDAVLGVTALEADDGGIETELKLQHLDADALGRKKMSELVDEYEHTQHEREGK
jgi:hypothetical protein